IDGIRMSIRRDPVAMRALYTLMFEGHGAAPTILRERMREFHGNQRRLFERTIARGLERGSVRPGIDPATSAGLAISTLRGAAYQWLLDPDFDIDRILSALKEHLELTLAPDTDGSRARPGAPA